MRSVGLVELEDVFITHFHADHVLGLPGMLKTFALRGRDRPLTLHGPAGRGACCARSPRDRAADLEVVLVELAPNDELERDGYRIAAYATDHSGPGVGFALVEDPRPARSTPCTLASSAYARARLRSAPAGRGGGWRASRAGDRGDPPRPQARAHRRHGTLRHDAAGGVGGRPARARGDLRRRGGRPRRRDRSLDGAAGGRLGRPWTSPCSRSPTSLLATPGRSCATRRAPRSPARPSG